MQQFKQNGNVCSFAAEVLWTFVLWGCWRLSCSVFTFVSARFSFNSSLPPSCPRAKCEAESKQPFSLDEPILCCFYTVVFVTERTDKIQRVNSWVTAMPRLTLHFWLSSAVCAALNLNCFLHDCCFTVSWPNNAVKHYFG